MHCLNTSSRRIATFCFLSMGTTLPTVYIGPKEAAAQPALAPARQFSVRLGLSLDKRAYEVGEPISATIEITNIGSAVALVPESSDFTGRHDGYNFEVRRDNDELIAAAFNEYITQMQSIGGEKTIQPKSVYHRQLLLNYRVLPLRPGHYSVRCLYQPFFSSNPGQNFKTISSIVAFEVAETPPLMVQQRIQELTQKLKAGQEVALTARLLGFTGDDAAIAPLLEVLGQKEDHAQVAAAEALLYLNHDSVRTALLTLLEKHEPNARLVHLLLVPLQAPPEQVIPLLMPWLENGDTDARYGAVEGLSLANFPKQNPQLLAPFITRLSDSSPHVRLRAASAVGAYQNTAALDALKRSISDPDPNVREQATIAIGWLGASTTAATSLRQAAVDALLVVLQSNDTGRAREQAAYWLGKSENKRAITGLTKALTSAERPALTKEIQSALSILQDKKL